VIYEALLLRQAVEDIDDICRYLARFYPGTTGRFLDDLERSMEGLARNPYMYAVYGNNRIYRRMIVQDYLVFYKIVRTKKLVRVYRVLHGKRNIEVFLQ
jgi:addiction module RelE/StbE family toxin